MDINDSQFTYYSDEKRKLRELKWQNCKLLLKTKNKKKIKAKDIIIIFQIKQKQISQQPETQPKMHPKKKELQIDISCIWVQFSDQRTLN